MRRILGLCCVAWGLLDLQAAQADVGPLLSRIKAVGKEGQGNVDAANASKDLVAAGPEALVEILSAMDDAAPRSLKWRRSAVETIADRATTTGKPLPAAKLEAFVRDSKHSGPARRLAYETLLRADAAAAERL